MTRYGMIRAIAVVVGFSGVGVAMASPAMAAPENCVKPGQNVRETSWAHKMLAPERVWPFAQGRGVKVAVLDSGVDASHPQLAGRVTPGFDALANRGTADTDCAGTGTQVAGVVAASQISTSGAVGIAPKATIVPVRVVDKVGSNAPPVQPAVLARGIAWAVGQKVDIIVVSVVTYQAAPGLEAAVVAAGEAGAVVVVAAGDMTKVGEPPRRSYPAAYPGVTGVGAIGPDGIKWASSQYGSYVDLVAPGARLTTLQAGGGANPDANGTALASAAVAGTAALIRERHPTWGRINVIRALHASAMPAARGADGNEHVWGLLDVDGAVHYETATSTTEPLPAMAPPAPAVESAWRQSRTVAVAGVAGAILIVLAVLFASMAVPRGRRRLWRPTLATPPPAAAASEPTPPMSLFDDR